MARKKGVAIPYIVAIILGIAVISLLAYWFFVLGGKIGAKSQSTECDGLRLTYCQEFRNSCYRQEPRIPEWDKIENCEKPIESDCRRLVGDESQWCTT